SADGHPTVKLLDLGIAKLRDVAETQTSGDAGGSLTMVGQILGTPYYMSPEQWGDLPNDGNPEIDGRADIYSLGVMFYELLTGTRPLTGTSLPELRAAHVNKILPPLHEVVPEVPEAYGQAVARAIAKDRADRPQTAGEMADAIRASLGLPPMSRATYSTSGASATNLEAGQPLPSAASSNGSGAASASVAPPAASIVSPAGRSSVPTNAPPENRRTMPTPDSSKTSAAIANSAAAPVYETHPPIVAPVDERKPARSVVPLIAGALAVLLLVVGVTVGGWLLWQRQRAKPEVTGTVVTEPGGGVGIKETVAVVEAVTFWIESFDKAGSKTGRRVAESGELRLASGQQFKFHFKPRERGYFYILGPGERNAPTTILTAQPVGILKTNQAVSDADFIFPYGTDALQLDRNPGTEEYTVVFSPTPLMSPAFLAAKAFHELTPAELKEWEDFRAQHKTAAPVLDVKESAADGGRAVSVSVPAAGDSGRPIFFDVRIAHQ
ncbi:MAG: serine/threonine protein kinase, partial [Pyrinomonadaceae bacterium]|nr:serine/threonine protein kinase [Pyrinomonadaceae bacterium]